MVHQSAEKEAEGVRQAVFRTVVCFLLTGQLVWCRGEWVIVEKEGVGRPKLIKITYVSQKGGGYQVTPTKSSVAVKMQISN